MGSGAVILGVGVAALGVGLIMSRNASAAPSPVNTSPFVHGMQYHVAARVANFSPDLDFGVIAGPFGFGDISQVEQDSTDKLLFRFVGTWTDATGAFIPDEPEFRIVSVTPLQSVIASQITHVTGKSIVPDKGAQYFGRGHVGFPLSALVSEGAIKSALESKGFTNVQAWTDAADLPPQWPAEERDGNVFATGLYNGDGVTPFAVPDQVTSVWEIQSNGRPL